MLTPQPNTVPADGSTIHVIVDGVNLGNPVYNIYRSDIAGFFPDYTNSSGAAAYFDLDTTAYDNGLHTIAWSVTDNAGNTDGIGSRYFTIQNSSNNRQGKITMNTAGHQWDAVDVNRPVNFKKGYSRDIPAEKAYPDENGIISITIKELERVEIHLAGSGRQVEQFEKLVPVHPLPIGSTLDSRRGILYWQPGPGFYGAYEFAFMMTMKQGPGQQQFKKIRITIEPKFKPGADIPGMNR